MAIFLIDLDLPTLQLRFLEYTALGPWRLVSLASYGDPQDPLYAAIWHYDPQHPPQMLALKVKLGELGVIQNTNLTWQMLPTVVTTVYGPPDPYGFAYAVQDTDVRWNFVFEETDVGYSALQFVQWGTWDELYNAASSGDAYGNIDRDLVSLDAIRFENGEVVWTALLYPKTTPPAAAGVSTSWVIESTNVNEWEQHPDNKALRSGWARPELVVPAPDPSPAGDLRAVATTWRDDVYEAWPANMASTAYNAGAAVIGPIPFAFFRHRTIRW